MYLQRDLSSPVHIAAQSFLNFTTCPQLPDESDTCTVRDVGLFSLSRYRCRKRERLINWPSASTFDLTSRLPLPFQSVGVSSVFVDPVTSSIYHIESRPVEAGRSVIVDTAKGIDVFGPGWSASTRVGEYGGGAATAYGGVIYFSNSGDLRVYRLDVANGGNPVAVTPGNVSIPPSGVRSSDDKTPGVDRDLQ